MKAILLLALIGIAISTHGYATRYWDCCKPHCAWPGNSNPPARTCDKSQNPVDSSASSACDGGPAATCLDQIPQVVNENLAYAFAATPGGQSDCRKCYKLTFDGKGKYSNDVNHEWIKGKQLIVMSSNIGYDVVGGQFDVMIPGGGVGLFNGCAGLFSGNMGAQYGGLLEDCNNEVGYSGDGKTIAEKRISCLWKKCDVFTQYNAKQGCIFLADWMKAANCPTLDYEQTACPAQLVAKY